MASNFALIDIKTRITVTWLYMQEHLNRKKTEGNMHGTKKTIVSIKTYFKYMKLYENI